MDSVISNDSAALLRPALSDLISGHQFSLLNDQLRRSLLRVGRIAIFREQSSNCSPHVSANRLSVRPVERSLTLDTLGQLSRNQTQSVILQHFPLELQ